MTAAKVTAAAARHAAAGSGLDGHFPLPLQGKLDEPLTHLVMSFLGYGPSVPAGLRTRGRRMPGSERLNMRSGRSRRPGSSRRCQ